MTEEQKDKPVAAPSSENLVEKTSITDFERTFLEGSGHSDRHKASLSGEEELNVRPIIFDNHWLITERLGEGGMSVVYKARHLELNRIVAIKVLLPHLTCNMKNLQRFRQEAITASALNHPNVIRVENFGITPDGRTFIVMDFIEGISLGDLIAKEGKVDPMRALFIFVQCANALQHAHERNVIHRDLKPSNVMLLDGGASGESVKIVDFGIAKLVLDDEDQVQHLTQTGEVFGSPLYMSPEQCRGEKLDNRSDIYSMGVLMYETLTGRAPLKGTNVLDTMQKQLGELPEPIVDDKAPDSLLKRLNTVVMKALQKDPALRYRTMQELEADLHTALMTAEKDWRHRAKVLQKTYKKFKPQRWSARRIAAMYAIWVAVVFIGYFGVKVAMFDPLSAMELEQESLFSRVDIPKPPPLDGRFAVRAEQMDVVVSRDMPLWRAIAERLSRGDKRIEDFDRVTNELIPDAISAAKLYREAGNWVTAIKYGNWVLEMYDALGQPDGAEYVSAYTLQGRDYLCINNFSEAQNCFAQALARAIKSLSSDGKQETVMGLNFALMRISVHERDFEGALRQAGRIKKCFQSMNRSQRYGPYLPGQLAFASEVADIERLNDMPRSVDDFKKAIADWTSFIEASKSNDKYEWQEYLAKTRYGLALAEAQQKEFGTASRDMEIANQFFQNRGKDPDLNARVRKNYLFLLRKTNPAEYMLKSLRS